MKKKWQHKWFGIWKENGDDYKKCPSINDYIDKNWEHKGRLADIVKYLSTGNVVASTSRMNFPCIFTKKIFTGTISYCTDGEWLWLDDLSYYIEHFDVIIPDEFLSHIVNNSFKCPLINNVESLNLEWPPV